MAARPWLVRLVRLDSAGGRFGAERLPAGVRVGPSVAMRDTDPDHEFGPNFGPCRLDPA